MSEHVKTPQWPTVVHVCRAVPPFRLGFVSFPKEDVADRVGKRVTCPDCHVEFVHVRLDAEEETA
jgi:hypothetical protein